MSRNIGFLIVCFYNLALLAGACYMIQVYDWSAWLLLLALMFGASWNSKEKTTVETGK
jgi:hypothetical protein